MLVFFMQKCERDARVSRTSFWFHVVYALIPPLSAFLRRERESIGMNYWEHTSAFAHIALRKREREKLLISFNDSLREMCVCVCSFHISIFKYHDRATRLIPLVVGINILSVPKKLNMKQFLPSLPLLIMSLDRILL